MVTNGLPKSNYCQVFKTMTFFVAGLTLPGTEILTFLGILEQ